MNISSELSIIISFFGFCWIFMRKIYPLIAKTLDDHIESVRSKIREAELLQEEAYIAFKRANEKKSDIEGMIEENRRISIKKIKQLHEENEKYLKSLHERYEASLQARLEAELAKQKDLVIEKLSEIINERLSEEINDSSYKSYINIPKEDLKKLIPPAAGRNH
ncbi:MAG: hypothetical protein LBS23_01380 [Holosporaceae bacterium]|jgi:F0F1-type ATP synthase membrane subunit b/b'|nr:hypothetical protein [Holosporaceae bacterium]